MMSRLISNDTVFDALDVFEQERSAWRLCPEESTRYNDKGVLKYRSYWVFDNARDFGPIGDEALPETATFERLLLTAESARHYPMFMGLKKALEFYRDCES